MTSARLTISTASDRWRALRFNSRLSGGAKTTLPKLMPTNIQHTHNESLTYCTRGYSFFGCSREDKPVLAQLGRKKPRRNSTGLKRSKRDSVSSLGSAPLVGRAMVGPLRRQREDDPVNRYSRMLALVFIPVGRKKFDAILFARELINLPPTEVRHMNP